jgi:hypothetical protein
MPDHFLCYSAAPYSSCTAHAPEQFALRDLRRRKPFIKELLYPIRDWDCPNVATFSNKIYDRPTIIPTLKVIETEVGEFSPSKTTPKKDGNNRVSRCPAGLSVAVGGRHTGCFFDAPKQHELNKQGTAMHTSNA